MFQENFEDLKNGQDEVQDCRGHCNKDCNWNFLVNFTLILALFKWPDVWPLCCIYNTYNDISKK